MNWSVLEEKLSSKILGLFFTSRLVLIHILFILLTTPLKTLVSFFICKVPLFLKFCSIFISLLVYLLYLDRLLSGNDVQTKPLCRVVGFTLAFVLDWLLYRLLSFIGTALEISQMTFLDCFFVHILVVSFLDILESCTKMIPIFLGVTRMIILMASFLV